MKIKPTGAVRGAREVESPSVDAVSRKGSLGPSEAIQRSEKGSAEFRSLVDGVVARCRQGGVSVHQAVRAIVERYIDSKWQGLGSDQKMRMKSEVGDQVTGDPLMTTLFRRMVG